MALSGREKSRRRRSPHFHRGHWFRRRIADPAQASKMAVRILCATPAANPFRAASTRHASGKSPTPAGGFYEPLSADVARNIFEKGILPMEMKETGEMTSRQPIRALPVAAGLRHRLAPCALDDPRATGGGFASAPVQSRGGRGIPGPALPSRWLQPPRDTMTIRSEIIDKALADFQTRLQSSPDSPKLQFNAGAASYKLGRVCKCRGPFHQSAAGRGQEGP